MALHSRAYNASSHFDLMLKFAPALIAFLRYKAEIEKAAKLALQLLFRCKASFAALRLF
jgi:hypothetical protein